MAEIQAGVLRHLFCSRGKQWRRVSIVLEGKKGMAELLGYSRNFIDIAMTVVGMEDWRLTFFYGHLERQNQETSWTLMKNLAQRSRLPWCCLGDFNDLLSQ